MNDDMSASTNDDNEAEATVDGGNEGERDFPAETPVAEMTAEQQAAYWKFHSRKAERRQKADRDALEKERSAIAAEREQLRQAGLTEAEKAIDAARNEGRASALEQIGTTTVNAFIQGRVSAGLLTEERASVLSKGLNHSAFLTEGGDVDLDGLKDYLDAVTPASTSRPDPHQGNRGPSYPGKVGLSAGADLYTSKHS